MATFDDEKRVSLQNSRVIHAKINVLDFNFNLVEEITGTVLNGSSYTIDATSDIRRTCSITIVVKDATFDIEYGSKVWLDKYIQIFVGIEDIANQNNVVYSNIGIFLIDNPKQMYDATNNTLSINGVDLMSKMTGLRNGYLEGITYQVKANTNIRSAMIALVHDECGFSQYNIDLPNPTPFTPTDLSFGLGSTAYNILAQLRDINSNYQTYFDPNGVFNFNQIPSGENEQIMVDADVWKKVLISYSKETYYEEVKNYIEVFGKTQDDGHTPYGLAYDNNPLSPFFIGYNNENIIRIVLSGGEYDNIFPLAKYSTSQAQFNSLAQQRAEYELYLRCKLQDSLELVCVPLYWLDVNWLVNIQLPNKKANGEEDEGEVEQYIIKKITVNLGEGGTQNISLIKYYPLITDSIIYVGTPIKLTKAMYKLASASTENYAIFSGYNTKAEVFDIYLTGSTINTNKAFKPVGLSFNDYAVFLGGASTTTSSTTTTNKKIWAYDDTLTQISTIPDLTRGGMYLSATTLNDDINNHKYLISGDGYNKASYAGTDADVYNESFTKINGVSKLNFYRKDGTATTLGNRAIFYGGGTSTSNDFGYIDVYDTDLIHSIYPLALTMRQKINLTSTVVGNHAVFAGGYLYDSSRKKAYNRDMCFLDEYLTATQTSFQQASPEGVTSTTIGDYAVLAGGLKKYPSETETDAYSYAWTVDKYLTKTTITKLSQARGYASAVTIGDFVLVGGGVKKIDNTTASGNYKTIDVYSRV